MSVTEAMKPAFTAITTKSPTGELRIVERASGAVLQQKFMERSFLPPSVRFLWIDVPTISEEEAERDRRASA